MSSRLSIVHPICLNNFSYNTIFAINNNNYNNNSNKSITNQVNSTELLNKRFNPSVIFLNTII
jgi:hypothetical protein